MTDVPYAMFRSLDRVVIVQTKDEFDRFVKVARGCRCGNCDCCRALEYYIEVKRQDP